MATRDDSLKENIKTENNHNKATDRRAEELKNNILDGNCSDLINNLNKIKRESEKFRAHINTFFIQKPINYSILFTFLNKIKNRFENLKKCIYSLNKNNSNQKSKKPMSPTKLSKNKSNNQKTV